MLADTQQSEARIEQITHGALLVETRDGVRRFISGEVSVRPE